VRTQYWKSLNGRAAIVRSQSLVAYACVQQAGKSKDSRDRIPANDSALAISRENSFTPGTKENPAKRTLTRRY